MKYFGLSFLLVFFYHLAFSQNLDLYQFNDIRLVTNKRAMYTLGTWAIGNIAISGILMNQRDGQEKYFHQMNVGWGAVNLGIASISLWMTMKSDPASFSLAETIKAQQNIQKILLFNAGLDIGYMMGGLYLKERGRRSNENGNRLRGFGNSIILQGAFLFIFDLATFWFHQRNDVALTPFIGMTQSGVGLQFNF